VPPLTRPVYVPRTKLAIPSGGNRHIGSRIRGQARSVRFYQSFDGGTLGATVNEPNTLGITGDQIKGAGTRVFDATHVAHGTQAVKITETTTAGRSYIGTLTGWGPLDGDVYLRAYLWMDAAPDKVIHLLDYLDPGSNSVVGSLRTTVAGANTLRWFNAAGTGVGSTSVAIPTGQFVRLEARFRGIGNSLGECQARVWFSPDSTGTPDIDINNTAITLGAIDEIRIGVGSVPAAFAVQWDLWVDSLAIDTGAPGGWIGPDITATTYPISVSDTGTTISDSIGKVVAKGVADTGATITDTPGINIGRPTIADTGATIGDTVARIPRPTIADTGTTVSDSVQHGVVRPGVADTGATISDSAARVTPRAISDVGIGTGPLPAGKNNTG
jgi:hypothetical protein